MPKRTASKAPTDAASTVGEVFRTISRVSLKRSRVCGIRIAAIATSKELLALNARSFVVSRAASRPDAAFEAAGTTVQILKHKNECRM
jgi:hypothetical protein